MTTSARTRPFLLSLLVAASATACSSTTEGVLDTFAGEWCTLRGLGSDGFPRSGVAYVGMTLLEEGNRVLGSGSTSRPGDSTIYPARFRGDLAGGLATITVSDLEDGTPAPGPLFSMQLRIEGSRDLVGSMSGDADFTGAITLVRLGPRCFVE